MPTNYNQIRVGVRLRWNDRVGITYRSHLWEVIDYRDSAARIQRVARDGTRLLTERRIVTREMVERYATIA